MCHHNHTNSTFPSKICQMDIIMTRVAWSKTTKAIHEGNNLSHYILLIAQWLRWRLPWQHWLFLSFHYHALAEHFDLLSIPCAKKVNSLCRFIHWLWGSGLVWNSSNRNSVARGYGVPLYTISVPCCWALCTVCLLICTSMCLFAMWSIKKCMHMLNQIYESKWPFKSLIVCLRRQLLCH